MDATNFMGLGKKDAQNLADVNNLIFRLVSVDGEKKLGYPDDERTDRVCVELVSGKVASAKIS